MSIGGIESVNVGELAMTATGMSMIRVRKNGCQLPVGRTPCFSANRTSFSPTAARRRGRPLDELSALEARLAMTELTSTA